MTDDLREAAARWLHGMSDTEPWPSNETLGGGLTGTRDDEFRAGALEDADDLLGSPLIARIRAEAWDDGLEAALRNGYMARNGMTPNPHRPQPVNAGPDA